MKKIALLSIFFCTNFFCMAQQLRVEQMTVSNEEGNEVEAWVAHLDQDVEACMDSYDDFMDDVFKLDASKRNKTMMVVTKAQFLELSPLRIDQRALFTAESTGTSIAFMFSPGYDIHFGTKNYPVEFAKGEIFVKSFVKFHYKDFYNKKIKSVQKLINDKQDNITSCDKRIAKNKKTILDNNTTINKKASEGPKLRLKNENLDKENLGLAGDVSKARTEITMLQDDLVKLNESLKRAEEFF